MFPLSPSKQAKKKGIISEFSVYYIFLSITERCEKHNPRHLPQHTHGKDNGRILGTKLSTLRDLWMFREPLMLCPAHDHRINTNSLP